MNQVNIDIAAHLATSGYTLGTDMFASYEPSSPDSVITIYNSNGIEQPCLDKSVSQQVFFQVRVRENEYLTANASMVALKAILDYAEIGDVNSTSYSTIEPQGVPIDLPMDSNGRRIIVQNYSVIRYPL